MTFFNTQFVYQYKPRNLFISYGLSLLFTTVIVALGLYSLHTNGVAHSTSFSALITTTRNSELDQLSRGHSLGALPLDKKMMDVKLRFGELPGGDGTHLGFGFAEEVRGLKKGGVYV